jgi:hypothetical protein
MKNIILALLIAKFAGVRKDGLAQLAGALATQATTDEEANALVEKFTPDQVNDFVKDFRKDVDKEVSTSTKTFESTLKEKFDLVEKKGDPKPDPTNPTDPNQMPAWAKALIDQNKALADKIGGFEGQKTKESRLQTLEGKLKDVPETFKAQKLKDFGRMNFDTDDSFNEYLTEFETDITALNQELADKGLSGHGKPIMGGTNKEGVSAGVASFITSKSEDTKVLSGKEL